MSIWADQQIKELWGEVKNLKSELADLKSRAINVPDVPRGTSESMSELIARYVMKFNKKPHHFMKPESIKKALET